MPRSSQKKLRELTARQLRAVNGGIEGFPVPPTERIGDPAAVSLPKLAGKDKDTF
jgi:hypothetical protein